MMKQKIKNDTSLAERMYWSLILSFAVFFSMFRINYPQPTATPLKMPENVKIIVMVLFLIISLLLFINFFLGIFRRKKNKRAIENITQTGIKVIGKVEDVIQKGISIKYILKVSYKDPHTYDDVTVLTPLLHKDPRHYISVGSDIDVYVDSDDRENFYIDVKDE